MSALFNFESLLLVILLLVCTCTYLHAQMPAIMDRNKHGYGPCIHLSQDVWYFLEICKNWREIKSLCVSLLCIYGCMCLLGCLLML
jgi:hypothetical protein